MTVGRRTALYVMAAFYVVAGANHFLEPAMYLRMMPTYLPWHSATVYVSGVAEIILGLAVLVPAWRRIAGWGLIALLVAVFPANVHMALNPEAFAEFPPWVLWARLPLQIALVWWARATTRLPV